MKRYFEFIGADSSRASGRAEKFWEISLSKTEITVRFGKIGANGQTTLKSFPDATTASREVEKMIAEKLKKGYSELSGSSKSVKSKNVAGAEAKPELKDCIACSEQILKTAKLCKHCGTTQDDARFMPAHLAEPSVKNVGKGLANDAIEFSDWVTHDTKAGWQEFLLKCREAAIPVEDRADEAHRVYRLSPLNDERGLNDAIPGTLWAVKWDFDSPDLDLSDVSTQLGTVQPLQVGWLWPVESDSIDLDEDDVWSSSRNWQKDFSEFEKAWYLNVEINCPRCKRIHDSSQPDEDFDSVNDAVANCPACDGEGAVSWSYDSIMSAIDVEDEGGESDDGDDSGDDEYILTDLDNLCTDAMVHLNQLVENDNLECVSFFDNKNTLILSARFDYEVIDVAFSEELGRLLKSFTPEDDDDPKLSTKHVYLEPEDFFEFDQEDTGFALLEELFKLAGCESTEDVRAENVLRNKRGTKAFFTIPKMK